MDIVLGLLAASLLSSGASALTVEQWKLGDFDGAAPEAEIPVVQPKRGPTKSGAPLYKWGKDATQPKRGPTKSGAPPQAEPPKAPQRDDSPAPTPTPTPTPTPSPGQETPGADEVESGPVYSQADKPMLENALMPTLYYTDGVPSPGVAAIFLEDLLDRKNPLDVQRLAIIKEIEKADNWGYKPKGYPGSSRDYAISKAAEYKEVGQPPKEKTAAEEYTQNWTYNGP
ncbi:MAG: hypothetical protein WC728_16735 [Elusimicrobiota bacterium]